MARPIKQTPILTGEAARRFEETLKANETKKVSKESYEQALKDFARIKFAGTKHS